MKMMRKVRARHASRIGKKGGRPETALQTHRLQLLLLFFSFGN
jgi:hypothetical protein